MSSNKKYDLEEVWRMNCAPGSYRVSFYESLLCLHSVGRSPEEERVKEFRALMSEGVEFAPLLVAAIDVQRAIASADEHERAIIQAFAAMHPDREKVLVLIDGKHRFKARATKYNGDHGEDNVEVVLAKDLHEARLLAFKANAANNKALTPPQRNLMVGYYAQAYGAQIINGDVKPSFEDIARDLQLTVKRVQDQLEFKHSAIFEAIANRPARPSRFDEPVRVVESVSFGEAMAEHWLERQARHARKLAKQAKKEGGDQQA